METESKAKAIKPKRVVPSVPKESAVLTALRDMVKAYTRHHADLEIDHALMSSNFTISIRVNNDDQGKMVGGGGTNIWALQLIFRVIGLRMGKRMQVRLLPPAKGRQEELTPFEPNPNFDAAPFAEMLAKVLTMMASAPLTLNVANVAEETHFEIVPDAKDLPLFRGDVTGAFRNLVTAIGKSQGRRMAFHLADPENLENLAAPRPKPEPEDARADDAQAVPPGPVDAIEEEARERGYIK